jgi:hypothetical protein
MSAAMNGSVNGPANAPANQLLSFHEIVEENIEIISRISTYITTLTDNLLTVNEYHDEIKEKFSLPHNILSHDDSSTENEESDEEAPSIKNTDLTWRIQTKRRGTSRLIQKNTRRIMARLKNARPYSKGAPSLLFEYDDSLAIFRRDTRWVIRKYEEIVEYSEKFGKQLAHEQKYLNHGYPLRDGVLQNTNENRKRIHESLKRIQPVHLKIIKAYQPLLARMDAAVPLPSITSHKNISETAKAERRTARKNKRNSLKAMLQSFKLARKPHTRIAARARIREARPSVRFGKGVLVHEIPNLEQLRIMEAEGVKKEANAASAAASSGGSLRKKRSQRTRRQKQTHHKRTRRNRA